MFLAEATAYDPVDKKLVTVRMCSRGHGHIAFPDLPDAQYVPCIIAPPQQSVSLSENGIPGEIQVEYGNLGISFDRQLRNTHWRRYDFDGYACRLLYGDAGAAYSTFTLVPGSKLGALESEEASGTFAIRGPEVDLTKDILLESYDGKGGAGGHEGLKGTLKPLAVGSFENWEPLLIDTVNLIYQFHGYGPTGGVSAVYENALTLGPAHLTVQSYEALVAAQLPNGTWAQAPAVGMFRLANEVSGKLTFDGTGALDGAVAPTGVASISAFMLRRFAGVPADKIDTASVAKLERDFPHTWGNCVDAQTKRDDADDETISYSVGDFVREAMAQVAGYLFATPDGVWHFGRNVTAKPPIVLRQSRSSLPVVTSVSSPATSTRVQRVRVGGRRCFSTHSDGEISSALKDAIEEVATGVGAIADKVDAVDNKVENAIKQLPDLVGPMLQKPIDDLAALHLNYGGSLIKASTALNKKNLVAIQEIGTRVEEDGSKVAESILNLTSRVDASDAAVAGIDGAIEAGLLEVNKTIANLDFASAETVTTMIANYGKDVTAAFNEERRVFSEANKAIAEDISQMDVRLTKDIDGVKTTMEGTFNDLRELIVDGEANSALAQRIEEMGVRITDEETAREAAIKAVEKAYADGDEAYAEKIETLSSSVTNITKDGGVISVLSSTIEDLQKTVVDNDGARAEDVKKVQSRLDNLNGVTGASVEQAIKTAVDAAGKAGASYVLKVQTDQNGQRYIAGMGVAIEDGVSAIAFSADSFRMLTSSSTPTQVFYADATGLYAPNLIVEKLKANSIDSPALKRAAVQQVSFVTLPFDMPLPRAVSTTVTSVTINKLDDDSVLKVQMFAQFYNPDDLQFDADIVIDGQLVQRATVNMRFDGSDSYGQAPVTPFAFLPGISAGQHTVTFQVTPSTQNPLATTVRSGATLEVTELRHASL